MKKNILRLTLLVFVLNFQPWIIVKAQRASYSKDEFFARRASLMDQVDADFIILFGEPMAYPGNPFRQDNDFYYLTGIEEPGSVLMMIPSSQSSIIFQPALEKREIYVSGPNLLASGTMPSDYGFTNIVSSATFDEYIARKLGGDSRPVIYTRISPPDFVNGDRHEIEIHNARAARLHYFDRISDNTYRVNKLISRYPLIIFKDITPMIDNLRVIKTDYEVEILRTNGRISSLGVKEAMLMTKPGVFEYQIEAAAMNAITDGGAIRAAYPPIVASGPNTCTLHYEKNSRKTEAGDLILMDFGGCLDYLTMDISRTWPVNGKFSTEQKKVYTLLLEIQKACIESYKPGVKQKDVIKYVKDKLDKLDLDINGLEKYIGHSMKPPVVDGKLYVENIISGFGHFVGMAVHDVGTYGNQGLKKGMVFAIEPGLYNPLTGIGIRIEDTVLITENGCEVLSSDVPKEIEEIELLMRQAK